MASVGLRAAKANEGASPKWVREQEVGCEQSSLTKEGVANYEEGRGGLRLGYVRSGCTEQGLAWFFASRDGLLKGVGRV